SGSAALLALAVALIAISRSSFGFGRRCRGHGVFRRMRPPQNKRQPARHPSAPRQFPVRSESQAPQVRGSEFAALAYHVIAELLPLVGPANAGTFHRRDVNEHVLPAVGGLNESIALLGVEELHGTLSHIRPPLKTPNGVHGCTTIAQPPSEFSVVLE